MFCSLVADLPVAKWKRSLLLVGSPLKAAAHYIFIRTMCYNVTCVVSAMWVHFLWDWPRKLSLLDWTEAFHQLTAESVFWEYFSLRFVLVKLLKVLLPPPDRFSPWGACRGQDALWITFSVLKETSEIIEFWSNISYKAALWIRPQIFNRAKAQGRIFQIRRFWMGHQKELPVELLYGMYIKETLTTNCAA